MFSHGIIHLSFSLSSIYPSVTRAAIPDLRVRQKKKAHSDSHEYVTSVCQPRYFSLFEGRERRGERKFHRLPKCWISMESRDASTIGKREGGNENGIWKSWKSFHFDDEERWGKNFEKILKKGQRNAFLPFLALILSSNQQLLFRDKIDPKKEDNKIRFIFNTFPTSLWGYCPRSTSYKLPRFIQHRGCIFRFGGPIKISL